MHNQRVFYVPWRHHILNMVKASIYKNDNWNTSVHVNVLNTLQKTKVIYNMLQMQHVSHALRKETALD